MKKQTPQTAKVAVQKGENLLIPTLLSYHQKMAPLVSIQSVTKTFGLKPLFEDISLVISEREKVALIGPNGSGKSTLLKIIAGIEHPDQGEVSAKREMHLGYVPQQDDLPSDKTVAQVLYEVLPAEEHRADALVSTYLGKTGFTDKSRLVSALSGGWRKRLAIARALIKEPDLLLLDEPTNHLDIESILWLEELVSTAPFSVLFVSHDRYFIENVSQRVIELDKRYPRGYLSIDGHYSDFISARVSFLEQLQSYKESLSNKVRREVEWLRQGAKARTTKAKGRIKEAGKLINELQEINLRSDKANLQFSSSGRKSKELLKFEKVGKALGGNQLFKNLTFTLSPGIRIGLVGNNGSGKSTLLKVALGMLEQDQGKTWRAQSLRVAFFDQARQQLNYEETLQQALCHEGDAVTFNGREIHVTSWARRFLFKTEQLLMPVKKLSGGEQARLLIARLMLQPADLLVLDEPTNDLDISTLEVLEETLCEFAGAVLLVTHDRYMLDRVSTSVIGLSNGHSDTYADYTQWEISRPGTQISNKQKKEKDEGPKSSVPAKPKKLTYAERLELEAIEDKILRAEEAVQKAQSAMAQPEVAADAAKLREYCEKLSVSQKHVEDLYARWHLLESKKCERQKGEK